MITAPVRQYCGYRQRSNHGAELIERLVYAECPAIAAKPFAGMRQHDVTRRIADCLADALEDDQRGRRRPVSRQRERGH
jgi:hypothetical protein